MYNNMYKKQVNYFTLVSIRSGNKWGHFTGYELKCKLNKIFKKSSFSLSIMLNSYPKLS